ncbi:peroxisomal N(1)-acetyl-spermine/spermidine oxidase isoform 4-T4 [Sarcoramphus papa]
MEEEEGGGGGGSGRRVVAVGAGLAGLGAAQRLRGHGSFRLLEATARAGGRVRTRSFASGLVEMGAHWIHGPSPGNPVFRLATRYGLLGPEAAQEENQEVDLGGHPPLPSLTYGSSGKALSPEAVSEAHDLFHALLASARAFQGAKEVPVPSVGQYLRAEIARRVPTLGGGEEDARRLRLAILATYLKLECCVSGTHSMDLVALEPFGEYVTLPGLDCTFPGFPQGTPPGFLPASPARAESGGHSPLGFRHQQQDLPGVRAAFLGTRAVAPSSGVGGRVAPRGAQRRPRGQLVQEAHGIRGPPTAGAARARPLRLHRGEGVGVHGDAERRGGSRHHDARPPHADREPAAARSQERAQVPVAQRSLHPGLLQLRGRRQLGGRHRRAGSAPARGPRGPQGNCFWPGGCGGRGGSRTPGRGDRRTRVETGRPRP